MYDQSVQTDTDIIQEELRMFKSNLLSRTYMIVNRSHSVESKVHTMQFTKQKPSESLGKSLQLKPFLYDHQKQYRNYNKMKLKRLSPASFHIDTDNHIATPYQKLNTHQPLHVIPRKINQPQNPYRMKTCPDDSKFCDRVIYNQVFPDKLKLLDVLKVFK